MQCDRQLQNLDKEPFQMTDNSLHRSQRKNISLHSLGSWTCEANLVSVLECCVCCRHRSRSPAHSRLKSLGTQFLGGWISNDRNTHQVDVRLAMTILVVSTQECETVDLTHNNLLCNTQYARNA